MLNIGTEVLYRNKKYTVIYIYNNGYCEIKEKGNIFSRVELVKMTEIKDQQQK